MLVLILEVKPENFKVIQGTCCHVHPRVGSCCLGSFFFFPLPPSFRNKGGWWNTRNKITFENICFKYSKGRVPSQQRDVGDQTSLNFWRDFSTQVPQKSCPVPVCSVINLLADDMILNFILLKVESNILLVI